MIMTAQKNSADLFEEYHSIRSLLASELEADEALLNTAKQKKLEQQNRHVTEPEADIEDFTSAPEEKMPDEVIAEYNSKEKSNEEPEEIKSSKKIEEITLPTKIEEKKETYHLFNPVPQDVIDKITPSSYQEEEKIEEEVKLTSEVPIEEEQVSDSGKNKKDKKPLIPEIKIDSKTVINAFDTTLTKSIKGYNKITDKLYEKKKYKEGFTQDFIPIKCFKYGMIQTYDDRYVKILEILPINFYDKAAIKANEITYAFSRFFKSSNVYLQFKVITDKSNPSKLIEQINRKVNTDNSGSKDLTRELADDYIDTIKTLSQNGGLTKRFFIIYQYEGDEKGHKSNDINEIWEAMFRIQRDIVSEFADMGNCVLVPNQNELNLYLAEILYYHFNKETCLTESLEERLYRLDHDQSVFNKATGLNKSFTEVDSVAPRGIDFRYKTFTKMDGSYYTYLALKDESYKRCVRAGWLDYFTRDESLELDIFTKRLPPDIINYTLEKRIQFRKGDARQAQKKNSAKYEEIMSELNDDMYVQKQLQSGDELYDVCVIITIRAKTYKQMYEKKRTFMKFLKKEMIFFEETYLTAEDFAYMSMPLLNINWSIFNRNKHNMTTSQLASLYMFTAYEIYDPTGYLIGINTKNTTLAAINNFNTSIYKNGNIMISGTPGSGKSFLEMILGRRMRISGVRVFYILPVKGYEYKKGCEAIGGAYIKIAPSLNACINFLDIRNECTIDKDMLEEGVVFDNTSLLSKRILSCTTFISLLMRRELSTTEVSHLEKALRKTYAKFGITDDDNSIYTNNTHMQRKLMPVASDLRKETLQDDSLQEVSEVLDVFENGNLVNFNKQTNVNLNNMFTVFDVDENDIGSYYLPALLYLVTDIVYTISKANRLTYKAIFLDEIWKLLIVPSSAQQIQQMVKLVRGYGAATVMATQDILDFTSSKFGEAVVSDSQLRFFFKLEDNEIERLSRSVKLTEQDMADIASLKKGNCLFMSNGDKGKLRVMASNRDISDFTTDINVLRKMSGMS